MNRHKFLHIILYLVAFVLTLALVLPAITAAQDSEGLRQEKQSLGQANSGWIQDGTNVYIEGGNVGIGGKPFEYGRYPSLSLKTVPDEKSRIFFGENSQYGFDIIYDSSVNDPHGPSSALFGIWRRDGKGPKELITAYRHNGNIGIGMIPHPVDAVRLKLAGDMMNKGLPIPTAANPGPFNDPGESAYLYLGDLANYIKSVNGLGVQIGTYNAPDAITLHHSSGFVGIGTESPRAMLEISGHSGIAGMHLSLAEAETQLGHNSPMIKWDSTAASTVGSPIENLWWARSEGSSWVLAAAKPVYDPNDSTTFPHYLIRAYPNGEICIGTCQ